jgi:hypothetical protein
MIAPRASWYTTPYAIVSNSAWKFIPLSVRIFSVSYCAPEFQADLDSSSVIRRCNASFSSRSALILVILICLLKPLVILPI